MGVRKAQDAPIATAMRKESGLTPSAEAVPMAIGHITAAVAALFIRSDRNMVTTRISVSTAIALPWASVVSRKVATRSAAPVAAIASATGISAASNTMAGQSMAL